jgi:hypothetical protein
MTANTGSSVDVSDRNGAGMVTEIKGMVNNRVAVGGRERSNLEFRSLPRTCSRALPAAGMAMRAALLYSASLDSCETEPAALGKSGNDNTCWIDIRLLR